MKATSGFVYITRGLSRNDTRGESCEVVRDRTRGREIHGLTCRTWVEHGPLKLLSAATWEAAHVSLRTHCRNASRADSRPWGATWSVETGPIPPSETSPRRKYRTRYFRAREIYRVSKYVAELLGSSTEKPPQEARREICLRLRKRMQMWESRVNFRRVRK